MSSYGAIPTSEEEAQNTPHVEEEEPSTISELQNRIGEILESEKAHLFIVGLTIVDILLVICQIGASLLGYDHSKEAQAVLEGFAHASLAIVSFFVVEILLKLFSFGPGYFWTNQPFGLLHLLDAAIIFISFFLEVFLKGEEQELSGLLIIFRLWRVVKLAGSVAIETAEHNQGAIKKYRKRIESLEQQVEDLQAENERLRAGTESQV
ncbi:hypothetical protein BGW38_008592 [Lunasporangiospora selenospora]|uniref:Voltage-gated hydrogen channel 1 n=1 Tax=Lunasporangiospora selenospora TaxID=979761 RepID=A0A9P6KG78_9FUNG|nr:hypothetical protein BGW38_008592 [Lunasporangiospora selenospora]